MKGGIQTKTIFGCRTDRTGWQGLGDESEEREEETLETVFLWPDYEGHGIANLGLIYDIG